MTKNTKGRYDIEFKKMIVNNYEKGASVITLCNDYELKEGTVYKWIDQYATKQARGNAAKPKANVSNSELDELNKRVAKLERENDLLKKCVTIFSRD